MGKFFRLFKILKKKKKQDDNFLIKEDIKSIDHLLVKRHKTVKEIENIDQKIILIQKSTKTTVPQLRPLHDTLRQRYKWYYNWHLSPYSRATHFLVLGVYFLAIILFSAHYLSTPKTVYAAPYTCVFNNVNGVWADANNWNTCSGEYPGQNADQPYDVTIPAGETVLLDSYIDLYSGSIEVFGTLYLSYNNLSVNNFNVKPGGAIPNGDGARISISGNWDSTAGTFGLGNFIVFTAPSGDQYLNTINNQKITSLYHSGAGTLHLNSSIIIDSEFVNYGYFSGDFHDAIFTGYWTNYGSYDSGYGSTTMNNAVICEQGGSDFSPGVYITGTVSLSPSCGDWSSGGFADLIVNGTLVIGAQSLGNYGEGSGMVISSGATVSMTTGSLKLNSHLDIENGGVLSAGNSTIEFIGYPGGNTQNFLSSGNTLWNVVHSGGGTLQLLDDITINSNLTNSAGTFNVNNHTVNLNGPSAQAVSGNISFNNLNINNTSTAGVSFNSASTIANTLSYHQSNGKITFKNGATHSIGNLDIIGGGGDVDNALKLRSTSPGQGYNLSLSNITNFDYVDLQDAHKNGNLISITHAKDSGGNSGFYLTDSYDLTANTPEKAGVGWQETVTAKDFYGGTAVSDSATTFSVSSSSGNIKFYINDKYETQTDGYTLSSGVATIYLKSISTKDEEITYTITDSLGKVVTSDVISVAGNPLADNYLSLIAPPKTTNDQVSPTLSALPTKKQETTAETTAETAAKILAPVAQALALVGLIPLILQILQAIPSAAPLATSVFPALFTTASVRRRKKPWGNVFDSLTGHPVDLAVVRLYEKSTSKLVSTQVTDFDGRFHFLAGTGTYYIQVKKKGYEFPAKISKFKASQLSSRFGKDSDIYLGVPFTIQNKNAQINLNIPIDPVLEKLTNNIKFKKIVKESFEWFLIGISYIAFPLMMIGAAIAALSTVVIASKVNFVTDVVYFFLLSGFLVTSRIRQNRLGQVFDSENKKPIIGAMVTVFDQEYNAIRQTQTTDRNGNFSILAQKGAYYIIIEKDGYKFPSTNIETTKKQPIYTGGIINKAKAGFIGVDVPMDKN